MNILYISSEYPPETGYGGIGTYTKYIAEGMAKLGHTVSVIARSNNGTESSTFRSGVTIHRIVTRPYPLPRHRQAYLLRKLATHYFPHVLIRISWALAVRQKVVSLSTRSPVFDIIEAPECGAESFFIPRKAARRHIIRLHTPWELIRKLDTIREPFGDHFILPLIEKIVTRRASSVSSPSSAMASRISSTWQVAAITTIPNPLPVDDFMQSKGNGWIYTGRIERRKGVHHLVAAYIKLSKEMTCLPALTLLGRAYGTDYSGNSYSSIIQKMIATSDLTSAISWIENATLDDVAGHLQQSSVAFFPSLWENYPYACLEAMACGCAVVASNCGGFTEIIESGKNGLLVPPDSEISIYSAMLDLLNNKTLVATLGAAAKQRVARIASSFMICNKTVKFYQDVLEGTA